MKQQQFLDVLDRDEAERALARGDRRRHAARRDGRARGRARPRARRRRDRAGVDVPGFDRANVDGFAVRAEDTFGASEEAPLRLRVEPRDDPDRRRARARGGAAAPPRRSPRAACCRAAPTPWSWSSTPTSRTRAPPWSCGARARPAPRSRSRAPTSAAARPCCSRATLLTSRETGVLAALGCAEVRGGAPAARGDPLHGRRARRRPAQPIRPGLVYDSNGRILADAVRELGGEPEFLGAFRDDAGAVRAALADALARADLVLLSGGTSKGEGDLYQRVVAELDPGIVAHGVALKPGKPLCLAAAGTPSRSWSCRASRPRPSSRSTSSSRR